MKKHNVVQEETGHDIFGLSSSVVRGGQFRIYVTWREIKVSWLQDEYHV